MELDLVFSVVPPRGRKDEFPVQPLDNGLEIEWQADFCSRTLTSLPRRSAGSRTRPCKVGKIPLIRFVIAGFEKAQNSPSQVLDGIVLSSIALSGTLRVGV